MSTTQPDGASGDGNGDDDAGTLANVPAKHRAGQGDPVRPAGNPMFANPAGAAETGTVLARLGLGSIEDQLVG